MISQPLVLRWKWISVCFLKNFRRWGLEIGMSLFKYVRFCDRINWKRERGREFFNSFPNGGKSYFVTTLGMLWFTFLLV